jgi:SAM-dependent methyltransferase
MSITSVSWSSSIDIAVTPAGTVRSMADAPERRSLLAGAWDEAAHGYERYFVPRFAPWVAVAVDGLAGAGRPAGLPPGPILVPCCGTFPELPALVERHPQHEIIGIDVSAGMVHLARERAAGQPRVRVVQDDAATLDHQWSSTCAGVVSVFGLQQLPDPEAALGEWIRALRPGGRLSVVFWPSEVEQDGPYVLLDRVLAGLRPPGDDSWQARLGNAVTAAGATVERDEYRSFPMDHDDAATFWEAVTGGGHLHALAIARGAAFMGMVREEFLALAPDGPWRHSPRARWIVARRESAGA